MKKAVFAAAAAAVIGGTSVYAAGNSNDVQRADLGEIDSSQDQQNGEAEESSGEEIISADEAVEKAQAVIEGTLDKVKLDTEDNRLVYEVELNFQGGDYDLKVDAFTGEVVNVDDDLLVTEADSEAAVSLEEAEKTAMAAFSEGKIDESGMEKKNGRVVYEIEVEINGEDGDVYIDAGTGEIFYIESDIAAFANNVFQGGSGEDSSSDGEKRDEDKENNETSNQISVADVKEIALGYAGGGYIDDMELEQEDGMLVFEVEVEYGSDDFEVYIDAYSGEILYVD